MHISKKPGGGESKMYISQNPEQRSKCTSLRNRSLEQNATFSETGAKRKMHIAKKPELRVKH